VKALRRLLVYLILPLLGYMIGATIFNHFYNKLEPGDLQKATLVAVAKSCERLSPVSWRGFGYHYECKAEIRVVSDGSTHTSTVTGWLTPEDIGKEYAAHTQRVGNTLYPDERNQSQVLLGWVCTFVFAIVYLIAFANVAYRILPDRGPRKRRMPTRYEPPAQ
jgi:hypothetical protein